MRRQRGDIIYCYLISSFFLIPEAPPHDISSYSCHPSPLSSLFCFLQTKDPHPAPSPIPCMTLFPNFTTLVTLLDILICQRPQNVTPRTKCCRCCMTSTKPSYFLGTEPYLYIYILRLLNQSAKSH